ncbi:unnamed protein product [Knipowitschia caucasica]|uniref:Uncharacterized protein n=1 Tax=Knipowitschia caucasica TaxID=637954 RepID=A0AAV2M7D5_KNICA
MDNTHGHHWSTTEGAHLCKRHKRPVRAFCLTDEQVICAACDGEHRGHTIGLVKEERRRKQDEVKKLKERCKEFMQEQDYASTLVKEKAKETDDFCEAILTSVIDLLQTHYMSLRQWVQAQEQTALTTVQSRREAELRRMCSRLDHLTYTDSDVQFLLDWPLVRQRCETKLTEFTDDLYCPFETLQKTVASLGNRLEDFCKREFSSIINIESGSLPEVFETDHDDIQQTNTDCDVDEITSMVTTEHMTREYFLEYACVLTLDPSTAHKDLLLSRDLKEVKVAPAGARTSRGHSPERFLHRRQLLCKEGLQENHCYYEVEISGDKTEIALAYEDIDRKSRFKPSAFGANENSWSLDCTSTHYSVSHCGDSVQLCSVPQHRRIGVFLQFRKGAVSFYEVSDTMTFLYTMQSNFRKPLYPGFWIDADCSIKICDFMDEK